MLFSSLAALSLATVSLAAPVSDSLSERSHSSSHANSITPFEHGKGEFVYAAGSEATQKDADLANLALLAEHLEVAFYDKFLGEFDEKDFVEAGFTKDTRKRMEEILSHERTHVEFLTGGLAANGKKAVAPCEYIFPVKTVKDFLTISRVLENAGLALYSGISALFSSAELAAVAGTILSIEARQTTYVRHLLLRDPFPSAFDTSLVPTQVAHLVAAFTTSCPASNPKITTLAIETLPALSTSAKLDDPLKPGDKITVSSDALGKFKGEVWAIFLSEQFAFPVLVEEGEVELPFGVASGQAYVFLSSSDKYTFSDTSDALTGLQPLEIAQGFNL